MPIFVEHWEDNLQFYPIFALFSTLGGINPEHNFVQMSKLSEDQKKVFTKKGTLFSPNSGEDQRKKNLYQKWNTFFRRILVDTYAQTHTRVKILGGYSQIIGGYIPPSTSGFGTPAQTSRSIYKRVTFRPTGQSLDPSRHIVSFC